MRNSASTRRHVHRIKVRKSMASNKEGESTNQLAQALVAIAGALSSSSGQSQSSQNPEPNRLSQSRPASAVPVTNARVDQANT